MTIAVVTGASGLVGGNLVAMLAAEGVTVRATKRAGSRIDHLDGLTVSWHDADLSDVDALTRAFRGADVVFHCAAAASQTRRRRGSHVATNIDGTRNVLRAVRDAGVGRLVHTSSIVACAIAEPGGRDVVEDDAWNFPARGIDEVYAATKREAEALVAATCAAEGLDAVIVNPGLMFGPLDAKPSSGRLIMAVAEGRIFAAPSGVNSFVDVRDVCRGMLLAWRRGRRGERYILAGETLPYREAFALMLEELAAVGIRRRPIRWRFPDALVRFGGRIGDLGERLLDRELDLNSAVTAYAVCKDYRYSSKKAELELGWARGPVRVAVRDAVAWFRARGML